MPSWKVNSILRIITGIALLLVLHPVVVKAQSAYLDAPHDVQGCLSCHFTSAFDEPNMIPAGCDPVYVGVCEGCHNGVTLSYLTGMPLSNISTHSSATTSDRYGNWYVGCKACHNQHKQEQDNAYGTTYGKFIQVEVKLYQITDGEDGLPLKSGKRPVKFIRQTGVNSFADGVNEYDGICEVCHTQTTHFRNDGSGSDQLHTYIDNDGMGGENCMACHNHAKGFNAGSHSQHVNGLALNCYACHDVDDIPYFKSGTDANFDGKYDLSETDVCDICHQDATWLSTGNIVPIGPPEWGEDDIGCDGCHSYGPAYGNDSPKANSHPAHVAFSCDKCHNATTKDSTTINDQIIHLSSRYNLYAGSGVSFSYQYDAAGGFCSNISCHGNNNAQWGGSACLGCHDVSRGNRTAITTQFSANSHHVQGITVENRHCYQCHWEADADGRLTSYHGGSAASGSPVDLVIYGAGERPTWFADSATGISYTADGSRGEIAKINLHCLGCHSDQNNDTTPFNDCNTPRQYAWDNNSIAARYSQTNTTTWGKYTASSYPNVAEKNITKAYSAHGNAVNNGGGYSPVTGLDESIPNTRAGFENVLCFDCHNAHGSFASGTTTSYATFDGSQNGGLLKNTTANKGGYALSYTPTANSNNSDKNPYSTGADLCFDCHVSPSAVDTPWGYQQTFGATAPILGYKDGVRFGTSYSGTKQRFPYRAGRSNQGGHMMASSSLGNAALYQINGLCTPCHDPHGISPSLGTNQDYGVPLLKGTWLTSPYKEDYPEMTGTNSGSSKACQGCDYNQDRHWNTDRVTFDTNNDPHDAFGQITEDYTVFAGLCLRCHLKTNLTDGTDDSTSTGWMSVDRLHETVKGWGSNDEHLFSCSKCHVPHNSGLPRLMQTNCLNFNHRQQMITGGTPSNGSGKEGWGNFPGQSSHIFWVTLDACHEAPSASNNPDWPGNQLWNNVTPW